MQNVWEELSKFVEINFNDNTYVVLDPKVVCGIVVAIDVGAVAVVVLLILNPVVVVEAAASKVVVVPPRLNPVLAEVVVMPGIR